MSRIMEEVSLVAETSGYSATEKGRKKRKDTSQGGRQFAPRFNFFELRK